MLTEDDPTFARRGPIVTFWGAAQMVTCNTHAWSGEFGELVMP